MGDERERRLLGFGGVAVGDVHADLLESEQLLDLQVLGLLGDRRVAPGVAPALRDGDVEHLARLVVQPLGQALGGLHAEAVHEQLLGELAFGLELRHQLGDLAADRHRLHGDHVELGRRACPSTRGAEEVGQADAIALRLARADEARQLASRDPRGRAR